MGSGTLPTDTLLHVFGQLGSVHGDFAEIGVFRGATFRRIYKFARAMNRHAHAFDSFIGLNDPGLHDGIGKHHRPKGQFNVGGPEAFRANMKKQGMVDSHFSVWPGYVPDCFAPCGVETFSFIYIDLDHHDPTEQAIQWAFPRLAKGAVIGFDDFDHTWKRGASPPIIRFLNKHRNLLRVIHQGNNQIFVKKTGA